MRPKDLFRELGACAVESIPAAKVSQRSIFPLFFVK
jgi:hypothetical protein